MAINDSLDAHGFAAELVTLVRTSEYQALQVRHANFWQIIEYGRTSIENRLIRIQGVVGV